MSSEDAVASAGADVASGDIGDATAKLKKVKCAVQFGYCGAGFHGLQSNGLAAHPAIEDALVSALHKAGLITNDNMDDPFHKLAWQRASRTDKGVSALRNLISVKLLRLPGDPDAVVDKVNSFLPKAIRVYGLQPVTASFSSHLHCTGREYEYYLPTFCLLAKDAFAELMSHDLAPQNPTAEMMNQDPQPKPFESLSTVAAEAAGDGFDDCGDEPSGAKRPRPRSPKPPPPTTAPPVEATSADEAITSENMRYFMFRSIPAEAMKRLRQYRLPQATLARARELFRMMQGSQHFHNFTPKGNPADPATKRFMRKISVSDPFIVYAGRDTGNLLTEAEAAALPPSDVVETEWVRVELDGQSFMLNQIRKMIGTVSAILAAGLDGGFLRSCLEPSVRRGMPMAPANGLFLVDLFFERYNSSLSRIQSGGQTNASDRGQLVMADIAAHRVDEVRRQVLASILREELAQDISGRWLRGTRFVTNLAWGILIP
jgi:tRNA pseudouridine38-40 synthase